MKNLEEKELILVGGGHKGLAYEIGIICAASACSSYHMAKGFALEIFGY